ncbi:agmatine deiminase family protein [Gilvibacter sp.]|uniref:agmatine deiminase family protein n=1 Tax=Gilvibacter sp. TaxID=2729997 RepID=UPI0025BFBF8D|nr:agmatine deiminase family protein [Gilvibacter sp.]NQX76802.1 agmatine deiminase family protein [Gilvibacter sp.]
MTPIKKSLALLALGLMPFLGLSQSDGPIPNYTTESESLLVSEMTFTSAIPTPPPTSSVRTMAEWEEVEYLVVTWEPAFPNILRQIVAAAVEEAKVIIVTQNETSVSSYLSSNGVPLDNVIFLDEPWNSIWIRDYAGNTVYTDDVGERALVDWIYNRPRPLDNVIPSAHASYIGSPIYITDSGTNDLVNTGGNFMSDGLGNGFASDLILEENEPGNPYGVSAKTEAQIDDIMLNYMGISNYIKMEKLQYDLIHHIDMHMKLLDEETLLVSKYPEGVADGPQIEENIEYVLSNFNSPFGTPYKVEWIDAPPSVGGNYPDTGGYYRTYSNSVFVNGTVLVPTYRPEVDGPALAKYQELLPGYNVVGIDVDNGGENLIALFGAIHCITHSIGVSDPLWIVHQPVAEATEGLNVSFDAMIKHNSGVSQAKLFWREVGAGSYNEIDMTSAGGDDWTASLTIPSDLDIEYYIWAEANSGKEITRPIVAPEGYWTIDVSTLSSAEWAENNIIGPYPNPADDRVNFRLNNIGGPLTVEIHNIYGQRLYTTQVQNSNGVIQLDLNPIWSGTLIVSFRGDFGSVQRKLIKQ